MSSTRRSTRLNSISKTPTKPDNTKWRSTTKNQTITIDSSDDEEIENRNMNYTPKCLLKSPKTPKSKPRPKSKRKVIENSSDSETEESSVVGVSPPKQSRIQKSSNKDDLLSPSRLLDRLSIDDEKAFEEERKIDEAKRNKFQNARRVLNSAETNFLPGREKELEELREFFLEHLINEKSGSLYVSGQPGTGKTACLSKLLKSDEFAKKFVKVYINCTSISTIGSIYKKICTELSLKVVGRTEKDHLTALRKHLTSNHKMILMVLDEIDQLCGQKQSVLYTIFEWPSIANSKLILIGIANSLDLTDRMLMRLNAKCELKPRLMHFSPYTKQQIVDIFKSRLEEAQVLDIFPPVTIQLLAAKVSAISGDVRRALDIGRRVVEIAEQQKRTGGTLNLSEFGIDTNSEQQQQKPVQVTQVMSVLNKVYGASQNLNDDIEESFPLQQKIILCCLMLMLKKEKNKDITIGRLHDVYKRVCSKRNILAVDQAEFVGCMDLIETRGIIRVIRRKEPRLNKVQLQWDEEEVNGALQDKQLIASILDDASCLGR
ncbi:cell division control protein 6 homolog [Episyrphus balteatus]|uniref:cell division control protein 6 homolog n=1 Tax=Episyrphus balteatus TaxID=286459 RepID=UPI00248600A1|nr:cell division control protein 6 homolog [Episyrphus balteatus]